MTKRLIEIPRLSLVDDSTSSYVHINNELFSPKDLKALGARIMEIPDFKPGDAVVTCDGCKGVYVGPVPNKPSNVVVQFDEQTFASCYLGDLAMYTEPAPEEIEELEF